MTEAATSKKELTQILSLLLLSCLSECAIHPFLSYALLQALPFPSCESQPEG